MRSGRGSWFLLCERSQSDPAYPRYPRLPLLACAGFEEKGSGVFSARPHGIRRPEKTPDPFWARYWFLAALAAIVSAGILFPEGGQALRSAGMVLPLLTASALFISGLGLETSHLRVSRAQGKALGLGLGTTYVVAPVLAAALALAIGPPLGGAESDGRLFFEAVMILAAQASTVASAPALTMIAGGNQGLALLLTLASNVLTVVLTPLVLKVSLGAIVSFPVFEMVGRMVAVVLLPVVVGQVVRRLVWHRIRGTLPALRLGSQTIILVFVYTGVCAAAAALVTRPDMIVRFLAVAVALHGGLLVWVYATATAMRLDPPSRTALVFCGTQKTLPNGIYLWDRFFAANPHGAIALVVYHVLQLVVDTLLVPWLSREHLENRNQPLMDANERKS